MFLETIFIQVVVKLLPLHGFSQRLFSIQLICSIWPEQPKQYQGKLHSFLIKLQELLQLIVNMPLHSLYHSQRFQETNLLSLYSYINTNLIPNQPEYELAEWPLRTVPRKCTECLLERVCFLFLLSKTHPWNFIKMFFICHTPKGSIYDRES